MNVPANRSEPRSVPLARRLARAALAAGPGAISAQARTKLTTCLLDFLAGAFEARTLPWARQAATMATRGVGPATIVGTPHSVPVADAAFANAVAGHGLVREDMHAGAVSHLGVVILPALLALSQRLRIEGVRFTPAAILGYEVGARLGGALATADFTRRFRPTGFAGPIAAAAACGLVLGLDEDRLASALSLAANTVSGLNEWPRDGGSEMFFHPGFAARNGIAAAELAELGAYGSAGALDGEAGLFAAFRPGEAVPDLTLFADGRAEILSVFNKPFPACNFAQTPCQAALALVRKSRVRTRDIRAVQVNASRAAVTYPGCDHVGPFARTLQAKMSIQFGVAAALLGGSVCEASYARLDDPELLRLAAITTLDAREEFTRDFPIRQGAEVTITLADGAELVHTEADVTAATPDEVRDRFLAAASDAVGSRRADEIALRIADLEAEDDVGELMCLTAAEIAPAMASKALSRADA